MTSAVVHTAIMAGFILLETVVYPLGLIRGAAPDLVNPGCVALPLLAHRLDTTVQGFRALA